MGQTKAVALARKSGDEYQVDWVMVLFEGSSPTVVVLLETAAALRR